MLIAGHVLSQFDHEGVYPDLEGEALKNAVINDFKTSTVLTYGEARDTFFRNIDAVDNVLECVYSGFKVTLDPNADPTTDAFAKGINTEHTFPRSKGASENTIAYSDMHHLFPTREAVNTARGSLPFGDIVDSQTDKWYFEDNVLTSIPSVGIDKYSELLTNVSFEPRESHKGDVARAYFYFYTMYESQANQADPDFFQLQQETLCTWHFEDPVDEKEWNRNLKIAEYQGGKRNPFILDCRLARMYCDEIEGSCLTVSTQELSQNFTLRPNPAKAFVFIDVEDNSIERYTILSANGIQIQNGWVDPTGNTKRIPTEMLEKGFYILLLNDSQDRAKAVSKFVKI